MFSLTQCLFHLISTILTLSGGLSLRIDSWPIKFVSGRNLDKKNKMLELSTEGKTKETLQERDRDRRE